VTGGLLPSIQCSTGPFWAWDLEDAMDAVAEAGYSQIELMVTRDPKTQEPELPLQLARERGLEIASVHGPFLVVTKTVWGLDPLEKIHRGVDMCRAFGAATLIVHPPYLWEREYAQWLRREAAELSVRTGVTVGVETMFPKWVAGRQLRVHRWLEAEELFDACSSVVLDTSHVTVARQDAIRAYDVLLPKLVHVHLSNNAGDGRDGHLELEQGVLPMERILERIRKTRYAGAISLELSVSPYLEKPRQLVPMLRRNREYIEQHLVKPRASKGMPRA
jgi:sugar phosphate isomerase/epimerase